MKPVPTPEIEISHVDFANQVLHSRRNAIGLTLEQIQQMASAIIVLDHDLAMARERAIKMLAECAADAEDTSPKLNPQKPAEPLRETKHIAVPIHKDLHEDPELAKVIVEFVKASDRLQDETFGPDEGPARNALEKACAKLAKHFKAKIRTEKGK